MATQTISTIITSMDINAYNQIPYADQYVPNNTTTATTTPTEKGSGNGNSNSNGSSNSNSNTNSNGNGNGNGDGDEASEQVVANNNKINQRQHGQPAVAFAITTANNHISGPAATITTTAATGETTTQALVATITTAAGAGDVTETASVAANNGHGNGSQRPPVLQTNL